MIPSWGFFTKAGLHIDLLDECSLEQCFLTTSKPLKMLLRAGAETRGFSRNPVPKIPRFQSRFQSIAHHIGVVESLVPKLRGIAMAIESPENCCLIEK